MKRKTATVLAENGLEAAEVQPADDNETLCDLTEKRSGDCGDNLTENFYAIISAKGVAAKQAAIASRNQAMLEMLDDGWKIPSLINLTLDDLPRLTRYKRGVLGRYLKERPSTSCPNLFVSFNGKPLNLANTYNLLQKARPAKNQITE